LNPISAIFDDISRADKSLWRSDFRFHWFWGRNFKIFKMF